jgi:von Willebrand factor type A domain
VRRIHSNTGPGWRGARAGGPSGTLCCVARCPRRLLRLAPLLLGVGCATTPPTPEPAQQPYGLDLQVVSPRPGTSVRNAAGLVEVTGRVGPDWLLHADVVVAIDQSNSALKASGIDLDGDGRVGSTYRFARDDQFDGRHWRSWTSDPDDAMLLVELEAARNLIRSLDSAHTRIGVLTYTNRTRTRAPLGSPLGALQSLDEILVAEDPEGMTDVARALRAARDLFLAAPRLDEPDRPRVVFLFSDGRPNVHPGAPSRQKSARHWAKQAAIEEAEDLTERQIAVCVLGFGEGIISDDPEKREEEDIAFLDSLARATGCVHIPIDDPGLLRFDRAPRFATPAGLELRNLTTGSGGRALRLLQSGLFDGFVELVPGENTLEVSTRLADGTRLVERRVVHYDPAEAETDEEREATARLLLRLRERARQLGDAPSREPSLPPVGSPLPE